MVVFLPLGDDVTCNEGVVARLVRAGADALEFGLPTRSPMYDGPVVKRAYRRALPNTARGVRDLLSSAPLPPAKPSVLMAYSSDVARIGVANLARAASDKGFYSILIPDLMIERPGLLEEYKRASLDNGLALSFFVTSSFPHKLVRELAGLGPGFVYMGLMMSTGTRLPVNASRNVRVFKSLVGETPLLVGFAIKSPEDVLEQVRAGADGVVVGSSVISLVERGRLDEAEGLVRGLKTALNGGLPRGV